MNSIALHALTLMTPRLAVIAAAATSRKPQISMTDFT